MGWQALIPLIVQYGIPTAEAIWKKATSGTPPTQADFDELKGLIAQTAKDRMKIQLAAAGIPLDSAQGIALLALT